MQSNNNKNVKSVPKGGKAEPPPPPRVFTPIDNFDQYGQIRRRPWYVPVIVLGGVALLILALIGLVALLRGFVPVAAALPTSVPPTAVSNITSQLSPTINAPIALATTAIAAITPTPKPLSDMFLDAEDMR